MQDFHDELGVVALGSRLKRLSDRLSADAARVHEHFGFAQQPKWFTLLALLAQKGPQSVMDAANALGLTQPAISQFSKGMAEQGLLAFQRDKQDSRKKVLALSAQGQAHFAAMQPMCEQVEHAARQLCQEGQDDFYAALIALEKALARRSLLARCTAMEETTHD